jgi:hypothetical protein
LKPVIKKPPNEEKPKARWLQFYQTLEEKVNDNSSQMLSKTEEEGTLASLFHATGISLTSKSKTQKREFWASIPDECRYSSTKC